MTIQATDPRSGWFTFVHHDRPLEYSWDIEARIKAIVTTKPAHEIATRLRCLAFVPETEIPFAIREAERAYDESRWDVDEARRALAEAQWDLNEARQAYEGAQLAYDEAAWTDDGLALALRHVPNAPWDRHRNRLVFLP